MATKQQREQATKLAALFSLLASETRCLIFLLLIQHKALSVQELSENMDMTHSAMSHQLGLLVTEKIVTYKKSGRIVHYRLASSPEARLARRALRILEHK